MQNGIRLVAVSAIIAAATFAIHADTALSNQAADVQLQLGRLFYGDGRYQDSLDAYQNALKTDDRIGCVRRGRASSSRRCAWRSSTSRTARPRAW